MGEEWDVVPVNHAYGARCMECCELLLIPREKLQQLIHDYSPWLRQRFEAFRADVVAAQTGTLQKQPEANTAGATLPHLPNKSCQGTGNDKCFEACAAVGAVDAGIVTVRGGPSSLARTDGSADARRLSSLAGTEAACSNAAGRFAGPGNAMRRFAANNADSHSPDRGCVQAVRPTIRGLRTLQTCTPALSPRGHVVRRAHEGYWSTLRSPLLGEQGEKPWHSSMTPRAKQ